MRLAAAVALCALMLGCQTTVVSKIEGDGKPEGFIADVYDARQVGSIYHVPDDKRGVDCWVLVGPRGSGIHCLRRPAR